MMNRNRYHMKRSPVAREQCAFRLVGGRGNHGSYVSSEELTRRDPLLPLNNFQHTCSPRNIVFTLDFAPHSFFSSFSIVLLSSFLLTKPLQSAAGDRRKPPQQCLHHKARCASVVPKTPRNDPRHPTAMRSTVRLNRHGSKQNTMSRRRQSRTGIIELLSQSSPSWGS